MSTSTKSTANPILSMTGFAAIEQRVSGGCVLIELRTVNHRYLELHVKIEDALRQSEAMVRECLHQRLGRGKVECRISLKTDAQATATLRVNTTLVAELAQTLAQLHTHFPASAPVNLVDILKWPGVTQTETVDPEHLSTGLQTGLQQALDELLAARQREGETLKTVLLERLQAVREQVALVQPLLPDLLAQHQEKLTAKLREALMADDERIRHEMVLFAQRMDVDEELARLQSHIVEMARILQQGGAVGKKLDFLMQEMNREANTLGSKSIAIATTQVSMQLKVLIEQMREQIQNIE